MSDARIELVAFVGLGAMGGPMCANLARKSPVPTLAYDLDPNAVQAAVRSGSVAANDVDLDKLAITLHGDRASLAFNFM